MSTFDHEKNKANDQSVDGWCVGDSRTIEHQFTTNDINSFAKLTGDYNPLHVDHNYAATTATGGQVVHGMLVASFISTLIGMEIPGPGALWNDFQVSWRKIVRIDDTLRFTATVSSINSSLDLIVLEIRGVGVENDELYIDGSAKVMVMSKKKVIGFPISLDDSCLICFNAFRISTRRFVLYACSTAFFSSVSHTGR